MVIIGIYHIYKSYSNYYHRWWFHGGRLALARAGSPWPSQGVLPRFETRGPSVETRGRLAALHMRTYCIDILYVLILWKSLLISFWHILTMFVVRTRQVRHIYDCDVQSVATKRIKDCEFLKVHGKTIYILSACWIWLSYVSSQPYSAEKLVVNDPLESVPSFWSDVFFAAFSKGTQLARELLFSRLWVLLHLLLWPTLIGLLMLMFWFWLISDCFFIVFARFACSALNAWFGGDLPRVFCVRDHGHSAARCTQIVLYF